MVLQPKPTKPLVDAAHIGPSAAERTAAWQAFADDSGPFRGAFEHAAIGMAIVDLDGRFLKVNPALVQIVGYEETELLARDFQSITYEEDLESDVALARQLMRGDIDHYHMEKRYIHKQGHLVWIQLNASLARDQSGRACYAISQIQDITARKVAQQDTARRLRHVERLTQTVARILQTLESVADASMYPAVLQITMEAFESPTGWFLRRSHPTVLVGSHISAAGSREVHHDADKHCEIWNRACDERIVVTENRPRTMEDGCVLKRSLVAAIVHKENALGLFHLADCAHDYDEDAHDLLVRVTAIIAPILQARLERDKLTPREAEVMDLIVGGMSQKQIATALKISVQTTAKHRSRILDKLGLSSDVELVHLALQMRAPLS
jgi:PAS domain S-box-containing protein